MNIPTHPLYIIGGVLLAALIFRRLLIRRYVRDANKRIKVLHARRREVMRPFRQRRIDDYRLRMHEPYKGPQKKGRSNGN